MEKILLYSVTPDELIKRIEEVIEIKLSKEPEFKNEEQGYLTRKEVCQLLKITLPTLHDWTKCGWLVSYKIGSRVLYKSAEVKASLQNLAVSKFKRQTIK